MQTLNLITDTDLRAADAIHTVDPRDPNAAGHQLWGHLSAASVSEAGREEANILEIALPSDDHVALLALIDRIEKAKGRLPPDVLVLRSNLAS